MAVATENEIPKEYNEFFSSIKSIWISYEKLCATTNIQQLFDSPVIPENIDDLKDFSLYQFLILKKQSLVAIISVLEQKRIINNKIAGQYLSGSDVNKLDIIEFETNEDLKNLLIGHVSMRIDFDNLLYFLKPKLKPVWK